MPIEMSRGTLYDLYFKSKRILVQESRIRSPEGRIYVRNNIFLILHGRLRESTGSNIKA